MDENAPKPAYYQKLTRDEIKARWHAAEHNADGAIRVLRESWRDDGAEGEAAHMVCDEVERLRTTLAAVQAERDEALQERADHDTEMRIWYADMERQRDTALLAALARAKEEAREECAAIADAAEQRARDTVEESLANGASAGDLVVLNYAQAKRTARDIATRIRALRGL